MLSLGDGLAVSFMSMSAGGVVFGLAYLYSKVLMFRESMKLRAAMPVEAPEGPRRIGF